MIPVYCINIGEEIHVEGGVQLMQLAVRLADRLPFTPICAHVNNKTENLSYCIYAPKQIEFLDADTPRGAPRLRAFALHAPL